MQQEVFIFFDFSKKIANHIMRPSQFMSTSFKFNIYIFNLIWGRLAYNESSTSSIIQIIWRKNESYYHITWKIEKNKKFLNKLINSILIETIVIKACIYAVDIEVIAFLLMKSSCLISINKYQFNKYFISINQTN